MGNCSSSSSAISDGYLDVRALLVDKRRPLNTYEVSVLRAYLLRRSNRELFRIKDAASLVLQNAICHVAKAELDLCTDILKSRW